MSSYGPPIRPSPGLEGYGVPFGIENGTNRNLVPTLLFDFYTIGLSCTVLRQKDRLTERWEQAAYMLWHRRPNS